MSEMFSRILSIFPPKLNKLFGYQDKNKLKDAHSIAFISNKATFLSPGIR